MGSSDIKPLKLHAHATGPNPIKVAIALEFLTLPYTVQMWDFSDNPDKGVKGTSFLKINPNGRVPALEDPNTGVTAWESGAILNYIRRVYDKEGKLGPKKGAAEQDRVDLETWEYFLLSTLGPMTGQVNWFRHYHSSENKDALKRYEEQTERCYGVVEKQLERSGGQSILGGGGMSVVDIHFEPWVRQHEHAGLSLDKYPKLKGWLDGMKNQKEVVEAYWRIKEAAKGS